MRARFLCVGTHHKTGTVWMRRSFRKYLDTQDVPTVRIGRNDSLDALPQSGPALCVNWESRFPPHFFDDSRARFFHIIRDPRDVLISGYRYHLKANNAKERWLYKPRNELGGKSYQAHLAALPDRTSGMLFEMDGKHADTLRSMRAWPYGHRHVVDVRYEDLMSDTDCSLFRAALERMNVDGFNIDGLVQSYWDHSLFGGISERDSRTPSVQSHIVSGATQQWRSKLPREVAEVYARKYGNALIELGYAKDHNWVDACLPGAAIQEVA